MATDSDRKMRFEIVLKEGMQNLAVMRGKLILGEDPERDAEVIRALWMIERNFNATTSLRLHINLYDAEGSEPISLGGKPPYGESEPPIRGKR